MLTLSLAVVCKDLVLIKIDAQLLTGIPFHAFMQAFLHLVRAVNEILGTHFLNCYTNSVVNRDDKLHLRWIELMFLIGTFDRMVLLPEPLLVEEDIMTCC